jgi:hypothetical protein
MATTNWIIRAGCVPRPMRGQLCLYASVQLAVLALAAGTPAFAGDKATDDQLEQLRRLVQVQARQIEQQQKRLDDVEGRLRTLSAIARPGTAQPATYVPPGAAQSIAKRDRDGHVHTVAEEDQGTDGAGTSVTKPPSKEREVQRESQAITSIAPNTGILTQKGALIIEPGVQLAQTNQNQFFFNGLQVVDTVLVGQITAMTAKRDTEIPQLSLRYGLTNRSEVEVKIPGVFRQDREDSTIQQANGTTTTTRLDGKGLGDVEAAGRYQLNSGAEDWPIFVANLRYKSATGTGPFDVNRDANGVPTELPTGSGFQAIEGGFTGLYSSDPAVFYTSASYLYQPGKDIDQSIGGSQVGYVKPGDAINLQFGMGFGINDKASFSLGYKHSFIRGTTENINGTNVKTNSLDVGAALLGFAYQFNNRIGANLGFEIGATTDAPDIVVNLRVPIKLQIF